MILNDLPRHAALAVSAALIVILSISSGASLGDVINLTGAESLGKNNFYSVP